MTESPLPAAGRLFAALAELRQATAAVVSYATLVRQAAAQQPPIQISSQRLSDWFGSKAVPADPAVVRFLVEYLQPRVTRTSGYQQRPLSWWLDLYQNAVQQRPADRGGRSAAIQRSRRRLGRPVGECDPLVLGVHPAIQVPGAGSTAVLPGYVPRAHDGRMQDTADRMIENGRSRLVTLVGGSSTGKTRACWELTQHLESEQPGRWWLWHPYDPTRPDAALADLDRVGPDTIVWLNEAQHYLIPTDPSLGEQIAAGLRTLLTDPQRGPVLVLATLWPDYWNALTTRPATGPDVYGQARDLLVGTAITMADAFTSDELGGLDDLRVDPRLREAALHAEGGRIAQYLAGAPELENRYRTAPPAARAIIQVAIDARRLGHPLALPHTLLDQAAPGYIDDHDWDQAGEDWLEQALDYTAQPCMGARGPLTRIRPRPGDPPSAGDQPCYRLADYLEQTGRTERAAVFPPAAFWNAVAATVSDRSVLNSIGRAAERRGRYHRAAQLYQQAADHGHPGAPIFLAELRARAGDPIDVGALRRQVLDRIDIAELRAQAQVRAQDGDLTATEALAAEYGDDAAPLIFGALAMGQERTGDRAGAETLVLDAADRDDPIALLILVVLREGAGDRVGAEDLTVRAADHGHTVALITLALLREWRGDRAGAEDLAMRAVGQGHTIALMALAGLRDRTGDQAGAEDLLMNAAEHGHADTVWLQAAMRMLAGAPAAAETLLARASDRGHADALPPLALLREWASDLSGLEAVMVHEANCGRANVALPTLAELRELAGDHTSADRIRRYGLTDAGAAATSSDFGPPGVP